MSWEKLGGLLAGEIAPIIIGFYLGKKFFGFIPKLWGRKTKK